MSNNPIANEGLIAKIKTKLSSSKYNTNTFTKPIEVHLIGMNNAIPICAKACSCCWDKSIPDGYTDIAEYVAKRSRTGHTSILEHSNYVIYMSVDAGYTESLVEILDICNYLHTRCVKSSDGSKWHVIIGGSYRGYCDLYMEADDLNNPVLKAITSNLYTYANSGAFEDICKYGLLDKRQFMNIEPDENFNIISKTLDVEEHELFDIVNVDSLNKLYTNLYNIDIDAASKITTFDLIKFVTVTIVFKNMSRTCTHQLVRHRNAITQESQRYVDYSKACFSSPEMFKPDKYDGTHKYSIRFGPSGKMQMTLSEIGSAICNIYEQLHNPAITGNKYALLKEDARAFLPGNVQCRKLYMTFTYKNLIKFLNLREDKAAQAEIRIYANAVGEWFRTTTEFNSVDICNTYTNPRLLIEDPFKIDVNIEEHNEEFEISEEDYIKAIGLDRNINEEENNNDSV